MKGGEIMKRKNLIKFRIDNGLRAKDIAEKLEITKTKYSNIENGRVKPSIEFACKFQEVFKVDDIFELLKEEQGLYIMDNKNILTVIEQLGALLDKYKTEIQLKDWEISSLKQQIEELGQKYCK